MNKLIKITNLFLVVVLCAGYFSYAKYVVAVSLPTFVQVAPLGRSFFAGTTNVTSTFSSNVSTGNLIVAFIWWDNTNSPNLNTVVDSCGNSYTLVGSRFSAGNYFVQSAYAKNVNGGSQCAVTANLSAAPQLIYLAVHEVSGIDTVNPLDGFASNANGYQGSAGVSLSSGSITTTAANDYILGGVFDVGSNGGIMSAGSGFTSRIPSFNTDNKSVTTADRAQATAGSVSAIFTDSTASNALVTVVAFKAAGGESPLPDTTPPSTPTNLSASAVSSSQINLTWFASTDNVGVTAYRIYRAGTQIGTSASNSYSDSGLSASTNYLYTVSAYDVAGNNSMQSASANANTQPVLALDTISPSIPTNLFAIAVSSSQINLSWNASTDNVVVTGYNIYRNGTLLTSTTNTNYSSIGLSPSTTYTYTVRAKDAAGNISSQSNSVSATTQAASSGDTITATSCSQTNVQNAINLANPGWTVIVPAGTCTWTTVSGYTHSVTVNKAITVQGAGIDQTVIIDGTGSNFDEDPISIESGARLTGFTFTKMPYRNSSEPAVKAKGNNWRIDHNKFYPNGILPLVGRGVVAYGTGLIDHNIFLDTRQGVDIEGSGDSSWVSEQVVLGTSNAVFIEDNTFTNTVDMLDGAYDAYHGARYVFRYNTITGTNIGHHGLDSGGLRSTHSFEIYNNSFNNPNTHIFTTMQFRGGSGVVFNNIISASGGSYDSFAILRNYRSDSGYSSSWGACDGFNPIDGNTPGGQGYPCKDQIGRTSNQVLSPVYAWNNTFKGNTLPTFDVHAYENPTRAQQYHIIANRDFFNNTQKPGYTPYTYPHPLVSGATTPPPTTYTITSSAGSGGSISPSGSTSVSSGGNQTFNIVPSSQYQIASVTVDGVNQGAITSYIFSNVTSNHSIFASFNQIIPVVGDLNSDGLVNSIDLSLLTSKWLQAYAPYDLNSDGIINSLDYVVMVVNWSS